MKDEYVLYGVCILEHKETLYTLINNISTENKNREKDMELVLSVVKSKLHDVIKECSICGMPVISIKHTRKGNNND